MHHLVKRDSTGWMLTWEELSIRACLTPCDSGNKHSVRPALLHAWPVSRSSSAREGLWACRLQWPCRSCFLNTPQRLDSKPFKAGFNVKKQSCAQFALSSVEPELQKGLCRNSLYRPLVGAHCSSPRCQTALNAHQYVPGVKSRCPTKDPVKLLSVVVARHPVATTLYRALRNPKVWGKLWL